MLLAETPPLNAIPPQVRASPCFGDVTPASTTGDTVHGAASDGDGDGDAEVDLLRIHSDASKHGEYKRYLVEFIDQPLITERPIDKDARIMYVGSELSNISFLLRQQLGNRTPGVCHYPTNRIARQHTCHEPDRLPVDAFQLPPKGVVDQLLDAYFRHVNPGFPVVDADSFMQQYRARDPDNPPSLLLLQAILVAGAHVFYADDAAQRESHKAIFFRRAKTLFDARFERNRDTVVQAALLLAWHIDGPEDVAANAWFWIGVAARNAVGLGMHRDVDASKLVPHNKRMWRRVWWLLFQCDVLVSLQYGRPQSIHLEDSNVRMLKPSDFHDCGKDVRIDHVTKLTELCIIVSKIVRRQFCSAQSSPDARLAFLRELDGTLAEWTLQLPESLSLGLGTTSDVWTAILHLHYNMALILLHRPQPCPHPREARKPEDVDICTNAAVTIQQIFQYLCDRNEIRFLWCAIINCLFTALVQLSLEVRISNPILAVAALRRYESALSSLRRLADYWPNAQAIVQFFEVSVRLEASGGNASNSQSRLRGVVHVDTTTPMATQEMRDRRSEEEPVPSVPPGSSPVRGGDLTNLLSRVTAGGQHVSYDEPGLLPGPWSNWQQIYWHEPESTDDILFSF